MRAQCRNLIGLGQLTELERRALTEEYTHRSGELNDDHARQRLREFMQVFTPDGAMASALDRQQENKALYNTLRLSNIQPVPSAPKTWLIEGMPSPAGDVKDEQEQRFALPQSAESIQQYAVLSEELPDFDTF